MRRFINISFITFLAAIFITSCTLDVCSSKRMYIKSYEQFIKKVEKKQDGFTIKDWEKMDEQFERFSGECFDKFSEELTTSERKQIRKNHFKYVVIRVKSELPFEFSEEENQEVDKFIDNLDLDNIEVTGENLEKFFKEFDNTKFREAAKEFGKGFEKLEEALENFGKELKESFEETRQNQ
jgi:hypothetical protein